MFPTRDQVIEHLERHAREDGIEFQLGTTVERIDEGPGGWTLRTSVGEIRTAEVVVATGYENVPFVPDWNGRDSFKGKLIHSAGYRDAAPLDGRSVLVVGPAPPGMEIALDLAEGGAAKVWLAARTPPNIMLRSAPGDMLAVLLLHAPVRVADAVARFGRRMDFGDLSEHGLPVPAEGVFSRLYRLGVAPAIIDKDAIEAIKSGRIEVCPASIHSMRMASRSAAASAWSRRPSSARPATGAGSSPSSGTSVCSTSAEIPRPSAVNPRRPASASSATCRGRTASATWVVRRSERRRRSAAISRLPSHRGRRERKWPWRGPTSSCCGGWPRPALRSGPAP